jgi:hypothetical protein
MKNWVIESHRNFCDTYRLWREKIFRTHFCVLYGQVVYLIIQTVIATQTGTLDAVAELADKVYEIAPATPVVASVNSSTHGTMSSMMSKIEELTREVASLRTQVHNSRSRYRQSAHNENRVRTPNRYRNRSKSYVDGYCWYHNKYGSRAHKCTTPCSFSNKVTVNDNGSRK